MIPKLIALIWVGDDAKRPTNGMEAWRAMNSRTPYAVANTLRKYSDLTIEQMWFFNRISLLAPLSKTQLRLAA